MIPETVLCRMPCSGYQQRTAGFRSKELIRQAIEDNEFLSKLEAMQIREIVDCMYLVEFKKHSFVVREGEPGICIYVIEGT